LGESLSDSRKLSLFRNLKWWQATILIVTILLAAGYALSQGVNLWRDGENRTGDLTNLTEPYSYIISTDGTKYWAKNGTTGQIDFQSTNFSSVFQSVISSLPAFNYPFGGGSVFLKYGVYETNNTLIVDRPLTLVGENRFDMTCIRAAAGLNDRLFVANNTYHLTISNLVFEGNYTRESGGDYLVFIYGGYPVLENVYVMRSHGTGLYINAQDVHCYNVYCEFCLNNGWEIHSSQNFQLYSCTAWSNSNSGMLIYGARGTIVAPRIMQNVGGTWHNAGLYFYQADNWQVLGGYVQWNNGSGIDLYNSTNIAIDDVNIRDNSQLTNNTYDGVIIRNSNYTSIEGCKIYSTGGSKIQKYAVEEQGTSTSNIITGNTIYGNGGGVVRVGSATKVNNNIGFVTENSGSAEGCVNGTWIAHGLAGAPNGEVSLTISGNNYINSTCWLMEPTIIASNNTMFQISLLIDNSGTVTAVTPTNSVTIDWAVEYKP
jgi:hypothetical protein